MDIAILVLSCDKNKDLFYPFYHCMEKYWLRHPEIFYSTESEQNPYYKTININYGLDKWTKRIRETASQIDANFILVMVDDLFLQSPVDDNRIREVIKYMDSNVVNVNFEPSFDYSDKPIVGIDLLERKQDRKYLNSVMCGIWNKDLLLKSLETDKNPWDFELQPGLVDGMYLITKNGDYLDWGYKKDPTRSNWHFGLHRGKWEKSCIEFLKKEGLDIDFSVRGIS